MGVITALQGFTFAAEKSYCKKAFGQKSAGGF